MFALVDRLPQHAARSCRPATVYILARMLAEFDRERGLHPFVFSILRTLSFAQKSEASHFHKLANTLMLVLNLTLTFPMIYGLPTRSLAQERKLTRLFSCAPARFCGNGGWGDPDYCYSNVCQATLKA